MEKVETYQKVSEGKYIRSRTRQITLDGMFVALTLVFTAFVNIQIPSFGGAGGLIHLGNVPLLIGAMVYGKRTGAIAGALGMGLFDLLSGWVMWAPCTILTCGLMGFTIGVICEKKKTMFCKLLAIVIALVIKIVGYFAFEAAIIGNGMVAALKSVPGNVIQVSVAAVIVLMIITPLERGLRNIG
ncbi:MAG: ECF transporter S component [Lachnospiraceae bacterium]|nr:ECF transporter S component [Lachnospiraceae bacterium]